MIARHVRVSGLVQGVGYRWSCVRQAQAMGLTGWVRNRGDGSVEALVCGQREHVEAMLRWMREQVPGARVDRLDAQDAELPSPAPATFEQRATAA